jgi:hypothetical protein
VEHRIILGGEQYLPFARSRIKAMRALGLAYISQRFEMPDGQVTVRIAGDQEYIWLNGSLDTLSLDSGVVDLISVSDLSDDAYVPGVLHETDAVKNYQSGFVLQDGATLRTKPGPGNSGQVAGTIKRKGVKSNIQIHGGVPVDATQAKSFAQKNILNEKKQPVLDHSQDERLLRKKQIAALCPASIFTGRSRLYVQALYGAFFNSKTGVVDDDLRYISGGNRTPYLNIGVDKPSLYEGNPPRIDIHTSSGVYFDTASGEHWLISGPSGNGIVTAFPLVSAAESWRPLLRADSPISLSEEDKLHLEAMILAYSRPDYKRKLTSETSFLIQDLGCGYGWHFNWSGTAADIVTHTVWDQGDGLHTGTTSTHRRLTVAITVNDGVHNMSAETAVITGPVNWSTARTIWNIVYPNYATFKMDKLPQAVTSVPAECSAPFYAFYQKDALQVCTMTITTVQAGTSSTGSPYVTSPVLVSAGDHDGFYKTKTYGIYQQCTAAVGADSYGPVPSPGYGFDEAISFVGNKNTFGWSNGFTYNNAVLVATDVEFGYPSGFNTGWQVGTVAEVSFFIQGSQAPFINFDTETTNNTSGMTGGGMVVAIPFDDAEAVCVRAGYTMQEHNVGNGVHYEDKQQVNETAGGTFWTREWWSSFTRKPDNSLDSNSRVDYYFPKAVYVTTPTSTTFWTPTAYLVDRITVNTPVDSCVLFAGGTKKNGNIGTIPSMIEYFQPEDSVEKYLRCCAGIPSSNAAIYTTGLGVITGMPEAIQFTNSGQGPVALVGWA